MATCFKGIADFYKSDFSYRYSIGTEAILSHHQKKPYEKSDY